VAGLHGVAGLRGQGAGEGGKPQDSHSRASSRASIACAVFAMTYLLTRWAAAGERGRGATSPAPDPERDPCPRAAARTSRSCGSVPALAVELQRALDRAGARHARAERAGTIRWCPGLVRWLLGGAQAGPLGRQRRKRRGRWRRSSTIPAMTRPDRAGLPGDGPPSARAGRGRRRVSRALHGSASEERRECASLAGESSRPAARPRVPQGGNGQRSITSRGCGTRWTRPRGGPRLRASRWSVRYEPAAADGIRGRAGARELRRGDCWCGSR
jgi:hypothetical protein